MVLYTSGISFAMPDTLDVQSRFVSLNDREPSQPRDARLTGLNATEQHARSISTYPEPA